MTVNDDHHKIVITKIYPTDRKTLFSAFTESQKMKEWFFIEKSWDVEVRNTLRVGDKYSIKMQTQDGLVSNNYGVYKEIDPPKRLVFTWAINKNIDSLVIVNFESQEDGAKITLTHDMLPNESYYYLHLWSWQNLFANLRQFVCAQNHEHAEMA